MHINEIAKLAGVEAEQPEQAVWLMLDRKPDKRDKAGNIIKEGTPWPKLLNATKILQHDTRLKGKIKFNQFAFVVQVAGKDITDEIESGVAIWMDKIYQIDLPTRKVAEAIRWVASRPENTFHPVQQYLESLQWDGAPRLDEWLHRYLGAEHSPLNSELGRRWLISMVARAYKGSEPGGVKVDTCPVLQGPQGAHKSTALRILAVKDEWFSDSSIDLRSKDAYQALPGCWLMEMSEMASIRPRDAQTVKQFLASQVDKYRPSFGRNMVSRPRGTVFCGTTNEIEWLSPDPSGHRRFWPIKVGVINLPELQRDVHQLWAESVVAFKKGERWWLEENGSRALEQAQEAHRQRDSWEDAIALWLARTSADFTIHDVLKDAIGKESENQTRSDCMRAAAILHGLGCRKLNRVRLNGRQVYPWTKGKPDEST